MEKLNGSAQVIRTLEDLGVTEIFGYPGAAIVDIYDELYSSKKIHHSLVRHEQAAVHMADGYARATGKVGVALVTSGPGATNTVTAIATAYMDSIPVVLITGQVSTNLIGSDAFQEVDTVGVTRPVVKHSFLCKKPEDVADFIRKAFYIASTGRKGPVVVDIPKNCQNPRYFFDYENIPLSEIHLRSYNPTVLGHKGQVKRAATELAKAKCPVLLVGGGVIQADACGELQTLARRMNLPVCSTLMGISAYPSDDRQFLGLVGLHGLYTANHAMHNCDLLFTVAVRFDDRVTNNVQKFCPKAKIVHIDVDPASISKVIHSDIPIVGDAKAVLNQVLDALDELKLSANPELDSWWESIEQSRRERPLTYNKNSKNIQPEEVIEAISNAVLGRDDVYVTTDVGQHQIFTAQYFKFAHPRHFLTSGGLGTMGFGFPAAAGVKSALPQACVICITGDGSFQMNMQELSTCKQYHLPVKIFILDNHALGMVRQFQTVFYKERYSATCLDDNPDFVKLADAFGHKGLRVTEKKDLEETINKALSLKDDLVIVDIRTDTDEIVFPWQRSGGSIEDQMFSKEDA
ncbi:MAG: biosynthetic-type acetolactate synthase large subunit [Succinivibrio sp.]|nr:biosynthetic-type acetolactate synthase large subunit [Succinivibrio sp.]